MDRRALGRRVRRLLARARRAVPERERPARPGALALDGVRRRLELLVTGLYGRAIGIEPAVEPKPRGVTAWVVRRLRGRRGGVTFAATDGERIHLPATIEQGDDDAALAHYRLLALEQAERIVRGTVRHLPASPLERDLYLVAEGTAVDRALAGAGLGAVRAALETGRVSALAARPPLELMPPMERRVEALVCASLSQADGGPPVCLTAEESLRWARETAARMRAADADGALTYRGVPPISLWGVPRAPASHDGSSDFGVGAGVLTSEARAAGAGDGDAVSRQERESAGTSPGQADTFVPNGTAAAAADDRSGTVSGGGAVAEGVPRDASRVVAEYPEWDGNSQRYRARAVSVLHTRPREAEEGGTWAWDELRAHAPLVRRVRERFARLRAHRVRLARQRAGDELDLAACVDAAVDRRLGRPIDDRLYVAVRPARRALAIVLLVDVSGSTDAPIAGRRQVIDVEKTAVLLAGEALDALGDPYAVLAFSSRTANAVFVRVVKDFAERNGDAVRRRIAGLAPEANTRLGAAVRHATALLERQPAGHRLLLILSDGQPNDVDHYQGTFAIEDSRQAVLEARARGVHPFCLTVDREQPEYMPRIFGPAGYTIMRHPEHLPNALLTGVRNLLGA